MSGEQKRLVEILKALSPEQRRTLLEFAEFLASRNAAEEQGELAAPTAIPRPKDESVVKAIKRLMATYPMLDRGKLLHETAHYMNQHVIQGRPAAEVIEDLERVFAGHYEALKAAKARKGK